VAPSGADDPLDPHVSAAALHEARSRLLFAARAVQRAWLVAFGSTLLLAVAAAGLFAVALFISTTYVLIWTVLLSAALFNVTRYWPQQPDPPGVWLSAEEVRALRHALDPHAPTWPEAVQLSPEPVVTVANGCLTLGLPQLACLAGDDLRRLVALASRAAATAEDDAAIRRARLLTDRVIGRGKHLRRRATARPRGLSGRIEAAVTDFRTEHDRWLQAFRENAESSSTRDTLALHHHDLVSEGWQLMRSEWLDPAMERGCWHPEPYSSLREFLAGAQSAGILDGALPVRPSRGPLVDLVLLHESEVADELLGERRADELRTIGWSLHPTEVTVPSWRAVVDEAIDVSRSLTGLSTPATVEGVLGLLESGDLVAVARHVAPSHGLDEDTTDWVTMSRWVGGYPTLLLIAVVGMAALDSGRFRSRWSWPDGTTLVNDDGWVLPLHQIADEVLRPRTQSGPPAFTELTLALRELGIDVDGPLWLTRQATGAAPTERPKGSFVAYQGLGSRQVIVTDRAMHVFGRPWAAGLRDHYASRMRGADELRTRMLRVWQGDETDQTAVIQGSEVHRARFGILTGGSRWRLVIHGDSGRVTLRGFGDGRAQEELVHQWLGDRLTTAWLHSPSELLMIRNVVGRVGLALALPALLAALVLAWLEPSGLDTSTAPLIAVGGVAALLLAIVPDVVMEVVWKVRGPAERPESLVPVRRYARTPASLPDTPHIATDTMGRPRSALEAITLDLGDLPRMPDAPVVPEPLQHDELRLEDLGLPAEWDDLRLEDLDLPEGWQDDFPDWPEEIAEVPR
jgi:hypothetical protein